jgi:diguanylate cyclase (GGDEF)-like protein
MRHFIHLLTELTACRSHDALRSALARALTHLLPAESVAIYRAVGEPDDRRWFAVFHAGSDSSPVTADADDEELPRLSMYPQRGAALEGKVAATAGAGEWVTVFPMSNEREIVSVLELRTGRSLDGEAYSTVGTLLQVFMNLQRILDDGQCDSLTGLLNRKTFDSAFFKATAGAHDGTAASLERRAEGRRTRRWVGMIDIDFFKSVNDRFGHLIGDEVLLLLAQLMRSCCRTDDLIYRFGGEEFVVLLQCPNEENATAVFERLRKSTARCTFPQVGNVTVSIGFTELHELDSPSEALGRADKAVYFAKEHGRNQTHNYAELAKRGELVSVEQVGAVELF